ncbi:MAG: LysR substrate-binding domain-containing protein [Colwellia sp.]|nr:LysR substrate-binding domain-containing protein [Colwellia sp.]
MFELKHLKTLAALETTGNVKKTAEILFTSQSALSHQLKELEHRLNATLFIRNSNPIIFTEQGKLLLDLAKNILPLIDKTYSELVEPSKTSTILKVSIACHACFQWLIPLSEQLKKSKEALELEFVDQVFSNNHQVQADILFTDEYDHEDGYSYQKIGNFELVAVVAKKHISAKKPYLIAKDFNTEILLTYPIKPQQLDIFKLLLDRPSYQPKSIKQVNNSHIILQMVAAGMGITTMPDWLVNSLTQQALVQSIPLTKTGIFKTLYARYHRESTLKNEIETILPQIISAFGRLYLTNKQVIER